MTSQGHYWNGVMSVSKPRLAGSNRILGRRALTRMTAGSSDALEPRWRDHEGGLHFLRCYGCS
jgi:hypothetical protein